MTHNVIHLPKKKTKKQQKSEGEINDNTKYVQKNKDNDFISLRNEAVKRGINFERNKNSWMHLRKILKLKKALNRFAPFLGER